MMTEDEILDEFRAADALLEGHFILSSGLRSSAYLQCARLMMDPVRAGRVCADLAARVQDQIKDRIDLVVSPAMGGVVVGYEMGRQLGVPAIFTERVDGEFVFRRGFEVPLGAHILMVEDVVTTGLSSRECIKTITESGGNVVGAAALADRSGGKVDLSVQFVALVTLIIPTYSPDKIPSALAKIPAIKPGSRNMKV